MRWFSRNEITGRKLIMRTLQYFISRELPRVQCTHPLMLMASLPISEMLIPSKSFSDWNMFSSLRIQ